MTAIGSKECPKANVLNAMPKSMQPKAKAHLKDIWMAETKASADAAFDFFIEAYGVKYDRAVKCLTSCNVSIGCSRAETGDGGGCDAARSSGDNP